MTTREMLRRAHTNVQAVLLKKKNRALGERMNGGHIVLRTRTTDKEGDISVSKNLYILINKQIGFTRAKIKLHLNMVFGMVFASLICMLWLDISHRTRCMAH